MNCIVTAGPTYEELDEVRRLTNFSTGRLGTELAAFLSERGHEVTLLIGHYSTWRGPQKAQHIQAFTTTSDLSERLHKLASPGVDAVFHAAAVSDFTFGKIWTRSAQGELTEIKSGKITTRGSGSLLAELVPTPKVIHELRGWFPQAWLVGWKFEVEGDREAVLAKARNQIAESKSDACVANGRAYGRGFGVVRASVEGCEHFGDSTALLEGLERLLTERAA